MREDFGEMYRNASAEADDELLKRRWEGVTSASAKFRVPDFFDAVRFFFGRKTKDSEFDHRFRQFFHSVDSAFPMSRNDLEVRVLAGVLLRNVMGDPGSRPHKMAEPIALAIVCADARGLAPSPPVPNLIEEASRRIVQISQEKRSFGGTERLTSTNLQVDFDDFDNLVTQNPPEAAKKIKTAVEQLTTFARKVVSSNKKMHEAQMLQNEEINMLWWVFGESSDDLKRPMADLGTQAACLVAGKELAALTSVSPGPISAEALLFRMLSSADPQPGTKVSLADAVNSVEKGWRERWFLDIEAGILLDLCPVLSAVGESLRTSSKTGWRDPFKTSFGFAATSKLLPTDLSIQVYQECLLVRFSAE